MGDPLRKQQQDIINTMTNWQRTQWAKGGAKKGYSKDLKVLQKFADMKRPSR